VAIDALNRGIFFNDFNIRRPMTVRKFMDSCNRGISTEMPGQIGPTIYVDGRECDPRPAKILVTDGYVRLRYGYGLGWVLVLRYVTPPL